jgi:hypothetical protein
METADSVRRQVNELNQVNGRLFELTQTTPMVFGGGKYKATLSSGTFGFEDSFVPLATPTVHEPTPVLGMGYTQQSKLGRNLADIGHFAKGAAPAVKKLKAKERGQTAKANKAARAMAKMPVVEATPVYDLPAVPSGPVMKGSGRPPSAWMEHVRKYRAEHPDKSYKQCLVAAKETYQSGSGNRNNNKGGKTAKFLRTVGNFVKPAAPLVKKTKRLLKPYVKQGLDMAVQQAQMEMMGAGGPGSGNRAARPPSKWMEHVRKYREEHPGLSLKEALKAAKASYTRA